jgi:hypothetical protein
VDAAQEVQDQIPEIPQFPTSFYRNKCDATRDTDKFCTLGPHLFLIQLRHASSPLQLVGQVQLYVYCLGYPGFLTLLE